MSVYKASRNIPANRFLLWMGGVGEVQLRLRVGEGGHHPVFFLREGVGRFDFGFGGHCEQCLHRARRIIPAHLFFMCGGGGLGRFDFGLGVGFGGHREQCLYKASCIIPANRFLLWMGGLGRFDFGFGFGFVGHCEEFPYKARCIIPATFFSVEGGLGRFDFGFGFGFDSYFEQCLYKARCIMPANFWRGGLHGEVRLRVRLWALGCSAIGTSYRLRLGPRALCANDRAAFHMRA